MTIEYPKREYHKIDNPVCVCGHPWHIHETNNYPKLWNFLRGGNEMDGKCKTCVCPYYRKDKTKECYKQWPYYNT